MSDSQQRKEFEKAAKGLGCDDSSDALDRAIGGLKLKQPPPKPKKSKTKK